jgi:hypothetical protein
MKDFVYEKDFTLGNKGIIVMILIISAMMASFYMWGYNARANDIQGRMVDYDNKSEECFTRNELDYFIYGHKE